MTACVTVHVHVCMCLQVCVCVREGESVCSIITVLCVGTINLLLRTCRGLRICLT